MVTVAVAVKVFDGIVLAADSAAMVGHRRTRESQWRQ
jgi:20S proteasome alpha/beta subunit